MLRQRNVYSFNSWNLAVCTCNCFFHTVYTCQRIFYMMQIQWLRVDALSKSQPLDPYKGGAWSKLSLFIHFNWFTLSFYSFLAKVFTLDTGNVLFFPVRTHDWLFTQNIKHVRLIFAQGVTNSCRTNNYVLHIVVDNVKTAVSIAVRLST